MMGPEFRPRSFKHSISSVTSPPLPLRSTRVKLKLLSASAACASSDDEAATHWNPRARRKARSPSWVAASTSTTSALRSVIALLSFFGQSPRIRRARGVAANAVPAPPRGWRRGHITDFSQKPLAAAPAPGFIVILVKWVIRDPCMKSFTLPEFAQNTERPFACFYTTEWKLYKELHFRNGV